MGSPEHEVITRGSGRRREERAGEAATTTMAAAAARRCRDVGFLFRFVYPTYPCDFPRKRRGPAPPETKRRRNAHTYARRRWIASVVSRDNDDERMAFRRTERDDRPVLCRPCATLWHRCLGNASLSNFMCFISLSVRGAFMSPDNTDTAAIALGTSCFFLSLVIILILTMTVLHLVHGGLRCVYL